MTNEIQDLMDEHGLVKNPWDEHKTLNRSVKRLLREAKQKWTQEQCDEAERLYKLNDSFNLSSMENGINNGCLSVLPYPISAIREEHIWSSRMADIGYGRTEDNFEELRRNLI